MTFVQNRADVPKTDAKTNAIIMHFGLGVT